MKRTFKSILYFFILLTLINLFIGFYYSSLVYIDTDSLPKKYVGLVLGASVKREKPSPILRERLNTAIQLYSKRKIVKILISGDNSKKSYREVDVMKAYLLKNNIEARDIFMDHHGLSTIESLLNSKYLFGVTDVIIITQKFHLSRALFLAQQLDLNAYGCAAHGFKTSKKRLYHTGREFLARYLALWDVFFVSKRRPLGRTKFDIKKAGTSSWHR